MEQVVWYVAYGSNLARHRLQADLDRGPDATPPRANRPVTVGHRLYFAGESLVWGGGRAYLDHEAGTPAATLGRAWLLTRAQWDDLHAQESGRDRSVGLDPADVAEGEIRSVGPGRYDVVLGYGHHDAVPVVTFTGPEPLDPARCTAPAADYLRTIATGLGEAHALSPAAVAAYLLTCPGVTPTWDRATLEALLDRP